MQSSARFARTGASDITHPSSSLNLTRHLRTVLVATIEERLAADSELSLLHTLANSDTLLTTVRTSDVRCALVSYRQEKQAGAQAFGEYTLDGAALRSIVVAARSLEIEAIWLDAWCYRTCTEQYDHEDFCRTLNDVIAGVAAVVWLPQSKLGSTGTRSDCARIEHD